MSLPAKPFSVSSRANGGVSLIFHVDRQHVQEALRIHELLGRTQRLDLYAYLGDDGHG